MPSPLSLDLRERVVAAVAEGASCHQVAARFGVSVSNASRWAERFRREGRIAAKPSGGDHASHRIEAQAELILSLCREQLPRRSRVRARRSRRYMSGNRSSAPKVGSWRVADQSAC